MVLRLPRNSRSESSKSSVSRNRASVSAKKQTKTKQNKKEDETVRTTCSSRPILSKHNDRIINILRSSQTKLLLKDNQQPRRYTRRDKQTPPKKWIRNILLFLKKKKESQLVINTWQNGPNTDTDGPLRHDITTTSTTPPNKVINFDWPTVGELVINLTRFIRP